MNKIDCEDYTIVAEYAGKNSVHEIVFTRDYDGRLAYIDSDGDYCEFWLHRKRTPSSCMARRRLINGQRKEDVEWNRKRLLALT